MTAMRDFCDGFIGRDRDRHTMYFGRAYGIGQLSLLLFIVGMVFTLGYLCGAFFGT